MAIVLSVLFRLVIALSVLFRLAIVLSVRFRFNASDYLFGIFMFFFDRPTPHRGVMVSVLASSTVDRVFKSKDSNICVVCFSVSTQHCLRRKRKCWLTRNQDNMSEWGDIFIHVLLFQWGCTIRIQLIAMM